MNTSMTVATLSESENLSCSNIYQVVNGLLTKHLVVRIMIVKEIKEKDL